MAHKKLSYVLCALVVVIIFGTAAICNMCGAGAAATDKTGTDDETAAASSAKLPAAQQTRMARIHQLNRQPRHQIRNPQIHHDLHQLLKALPLTIRCRQLNWRYMKARLIPPVMIFVTTG